MKSETGSSETTVNRGVMYGESNGTKSYVIEMPGGTAYFQRGNITNATDMPMTIQEEVICHLCNIILEIKP